MGNQTSRPVELDTESRATLSAYFEYLIRDVLCFKRSAEEVNEITESVHEMVCMFAKEIHKVDGRFNIASVKFVGSMKDGTCNGEPEEFDFLLVSKWLSNTRDLMLSRECLSCPDHAHLQVKEHTTLSKMWKDLIKNRKIKSSKTGFNIFQKCGFKEKFHEVLQTCVQRLKFHSVSKETGRLEIEDPQLIEHGPACLCKLRWKPYDGSYFFPNNLSISVDITPAIQYDDVRGVINEEEASNHVIYRHILDKGVMLIPCTKTACKDSSCFRLTFTDTENVLMSELSSHHKKCYRILKYLFNGMEHKQQCCNIFHSFALKTVVLKHHFEKSCDESVKGQLATCILEVIHVVEQMLHLSLQSWVPLLNVSRAVVLSPRVNTLLEYFQKIIFFIIPIFKHYEITLLSVIMPSQNVYGKSKAERDLIVCTEAVGSLKSVLIKIAHTDLSGNELVHAQHFRQFDVPVVNDYDNILNLFVSKPLEWGLGHWKQNITYLMAD